MPANSRWDLIRRLRVNSDGSITLDFTPTFQQRIWGVKEGLVVYSTVSRFRSPGGFCQTVCIQSLVKLKFVVNSRLV